jgi:hypothetical protein
MVPLQQTKLFEGKKHWDCTHLHCNKQTKKKGGKEGKRKGKEGRKERKKERKKEVSYDLSQRESHSGFGG